MKALLIDESGHISQRLRPALSEEGYVVDVATTKGAALWLAGELEVDVAIVCSARPGVHDVPVVEALRSDGEVAPILVLERSAEPDDVVAALDPGADDVVVSPVLFHEVAARLRALTRRPTRLEERELRLGTLRLDVAAQQAVRERPEVEALSEEGAVEADGSAPERVTARDVIELTHRETAMLRLLLRHPGQVVSRTRLLEHVWGADVDAASNVVDQVISHLRAKLDKPYGLSDIQTVRGVGYRMVDSSADEPR